MRQTLASLPLTSWVTGAPSVHKFLLSACTELLAKSTAELEKIQKVPCPIASRLSPLDLSLLQENTQIYFQPALAEVRPPCSMPVNDA